MLFAVCLFGVCVSCGVFRVVCDGRFGKGRAGERGGESAGTGYITDVGEWSSVERDK